MDSNAAMTAKQYEYNRQVESDYVSRIEHLLEPIVGAGKVRATVNADIDFTEEESTEELFSPNQKSVRSEQASESISRSATQGEGIPGALSNQPPAGGVLVEGAGSVAADSMDGAQAGNSSKNSVRNYELDKTIRHKRQGTGIVKRLSVGVLIDDQVKLAQGGNETRTPWTDDEIKRFTTLIEQTIGFDQQRGDRVNIINASFSPEVALEELPEPGLMEQPWIRNLGKQLLAGIIILILIFTVLRPTAKKLANYQPPAPLLAGPGGGEEGTGGMMGQLEHKSAAIPMPGAEDRKVEFAKSMVDHDAGRVANVVKDWLGNEAS
jgi:flagellar M-ring protein FliF